MKDDAINLGEIDRDDLKSTIENAKLVLRDLERLESPYFLMTQKGGRYLSREEQIEYIALQKEFIENIEKDFYGKADMEADKGR